MHVVQPAVALDVRGYRAALLVRDMQAPRTRQRVALTTVRWQQPVVQCGPLGAHQPRHARALFSLERDVSASLMSGHQHFAVQRVERSSTLL